MSRAASLTKAPHRMRCAAISGRSASGRVSAPNSKPPLVGPILFLARMRTPRGSPAAFRSSALRNTTRGPAPNASEPETRSTGSASSPRLVKVMHAEDCRLRPLGQVNEWLKVAPRLRVFVAVALGDGNDRVDDDEADAGAVQQIGGAEAPPIHRKDHLSSLPRVLAWRNPGRTIARSQARRTSHFY